MISILEDLIKNAKKEFDLTDPSNQKSLYQLTEKLLSMDNLALENSSGSFDYQSLPIEYKLALKLYKSRKFLMSVHEPIDIGIVYPVWGENHRLRPKDKDNPNGEDSLRTKLEQISWATSDTLIDWTMYIVDDGDPHKSGEMVEKILETHHLKNKVKVLYLANAIPTNVGPLRNLKSVDESQKGGAVLLGCIKALEDGANAVIYTDADLSVHLGQIGLLLEPYICDNKNIVLGDRNLHDSTVFTQKQWGDGAKFVQHLLYMVGKLFVDHGIYDTQAPFKLFGKSALEKIISKSTVYDWAFDMEWLLNGIALEESISTIPFGFIDSTPESNIYRYGGLAWYILLKGLIKILRKHKVVHNEQIAKIIDEQISSPEVMDILMKELPPDLASIQNSDLGKASIMSPERILEWISQKKADAIN